MDSDPSHTPDCFQHPEDDFDMSTQHPDGDIDKCGREDAVLELIELSNAATLTQNTDAKPAEELESIRLARQAADDSWDCENVALRVKAYVHLGYCYWIRNMWEEAAEALEIAQGMEQPDVWTTFEQEQLIYCYKQMDSAAGEKE